MNEALYKKLRLHKFQHILYCQPAKEAGAFDTLALPGMPNGQKPDLILAYVYTMEEMKRCVADLYSRSALAEEGCLYLAYPKRKNRLSHPPIDRDDIFPCLNVDEEGYALNTDYQFNLMVALDENYTLIGLKRLPRAKQKNRTAASQCAADYADRVPDIAQWLETHAQAHAFFQSLPGSYQRDWACWLYSAKTEATLARRQAEMLESLNAGCKSKQHWRAHGKDKKPGA